jgi:hypothetical protein
MSICKTPGKVCSIEADRFGKEDPKDPSTEAKTKKKEEDGIFFHGLGLGGCCEGHQLKHTRVPDLIALAGRGAWDEPLDARWLQYANVGGYSMGRLPMVRYVKKKGAKVDYAFLVDPSLPDRTDWGATVFQPWIKGNKDRKLLVIYGKMSEGKIIEGWVGALRKLDEKIRKSQIVVWSTGEAHIVCKRHIPAMEDPSYKPDIGKLDPDFGEKFG